jgi:hypothetical protein
MTLSQLGNRPSLAVINAGHRAPNQSSWLMVSLSVQPTYVLHTQVLGDLGVDPRLTTAFSFWPVMTGQKDAESGRRLAKTLLGVRCKQMLEGMAPVLQVDARLVATKIV